MGLRIVTLIASVTTLGLMASLLLARVHPFGDADLYASNDGKPLIPEHAAMPRDVRVLLIAKCADCHSTLTHAPVYGRFAPISWLLERDIMQARKHLDFSQWDSYTQDQQQTLEAKILQETRNNEMPLPQYRLVHWNSRITPRDLQVLAQWARESQPAGSTVGATTLGDPVRGQAVFEKRCTGCHSLTQNREGPRLQGVYGRITASVAGFPYSSALKKANITWNDQFLEKWLADPDVFLPGNNMDFRVAKPQERLDIVAFLKKASSR